MSDKLRLDEVIDSWREEPGPSLSEADGLKASQNTPKVDRAIQKAMLKFMHTLSPRPTHDALPDTFFEHGNWWLRIYDSGQNDEYLERKFRVVDTTDGFDFEEVGGRLREDLSEATAAADALKKAIRTDDPKDAQKALSLFAKHSLEDVNLVAKNMGEVKKLLDSLGEMAKNTGSVQRGNTSLQNISDAVLSVHRLVKEAANYLEVFQEDAAAFYDVVGNLRFFK